MLIRINILVFKNINLVISIRFDYIDSYYIKFNLVVILSRSFIK